MDRDKYPPETGRRRFVKGVIGSSALGSVGTAGAAAVNVSTSPTGKGGGSVQAMVIENTDGPAPRGMSQIPVTIEDGYVKGVWPDATVEDGVAKEELGGVEYRSDWFQYCGVEAHPGLAPEADLDNAFRANEGKNYQWQRAAKEEGERYTVEDFADYETWNNDIGEAGVGKPAAATWRSQDAKKSIPVQILRSKRIEEAAEDDEWLAASTEQGFIAWLNKCTHYCCVPGFKHPPAMDSGSENQVLCQCHQSTYDPFTQKLKTFPGRPRPSD